MKHFPVENRQGLGEIQDLNALAQYMKQFPETKFLEAMLDFHLLVFLATMDMLPLRVSLCIERTQLCQFELVGWWFACDLINTMP